MRIFIGLIDLYILIMTAVVGLYATPYFYTQLGGGFEGVIACVGLWATIILLSLCFIVMVHLQLDD